MRIAVSGAHRTGKTTLVGALLQALPGFTLFAEPYEQLQEEGHAFAEMPGLEDFELQLERSIASILHAADDCLFDRCPADVLAYIETHVEAGRFDLQSWFPDFQEAMQRLDRVVFVPVEIPDRFDAVSPEDDDLRVRVDQEIREILLEDRWSLGVRVLEVAGSPEERTRRVLSELNAGRA